MGQGEIRGYTVQARSTDTFGRVLCNARDHHFIVDGPVQNGCPGEAITPAELFLAGVAACGVELLQVIAREQQLALPAVSVEIAGTIDRGNPVRRDVTVFNAVHLRFHLNGVTQAQSADLVERFKGR
ncbi:MAG: OsmC family protein [Betaproteobacteria bacterium]|nr:OsmC family protein [Betaproteobacteria bacterium]MBI2510022.1 OsmC family protein [Betaproteobacteria bacterium]